MNMASSFTFAKIGKKQFQFNSQKQKEQLEEEAQLEVDTNIFAIEFQSLQDSLKKIMMGDPYKCQHCQSFLNNYSKLLQKEEYSKQKEQIEQKNEQEKKEEIKDDQQKDNQQQQEKKQEEKVIEEEQKVNIEPDKPKLELFQIWNKKEFLNDVKDFEKVWICEFCGFHNKLSIEKEEIPQVQDMIYLTDSIQQKASLEQEPVTLFCIDNSGSMSITTEIANTKKMKHGLTEEEYEMLKSFLEPGEIYNQQMPNQQKNTTFVSRKQCVLAAIEKSITDIKNQTPNKVIGLVTFQNEVQIIGDGFEVPMTIAGDKLYSKEQIINSIKNQNIKYLQKPIKVSQDRLFDRFAKLEEGGQTALGPALISSLTILDNVPPGSMIILCTDGLANIGLGQLDNEQSLEQQKQFYEELANLAVEKKIIISVITIKGEGCKIDVLNTLVQKTNGNVTRVNPDSLEEEFANIMKDELVALDINCKIRIHQAFKFRNEDEKLLSNNGSLFTKELKSATKQTALSCEYQLKNDQELQKENINCEYLKEVPFQAQIFFTSIDGNKFVRVITKIQKITDSIDVAEKKAKVDVIYKRVNQQSQKLAFGGFHGEAQAYNKQWNKYLNDNENINEDKKNLAFNKAEFSNQEKFRQVNYAISKKEPSKNIQSEEQEDEYLVQLSKQVYAKQKAEKKKKLKEQGKDEEINEIQEEKLSLSSHSDCSSDEEHVVLQKFFK